MKRLLIILIFSMGTVLAKTHADITIKNLTLTPVRVTIFSDEGEHKLLQLASEVLYTGQSADAGSADIDTYAVTISGTDVRHDASHAFRVPGGSYYFDGHQLQLNDHELVHTLQPEALRA